jgi:hypothetical protein
MYECAICCIYPISKTKSLRYCDRCLDEVETEFQKKRDEQKPKQNNKIKTFLLLRKPRR